MARSIYRYTCSRKAVSFQKIYDADAFGLYQSSDKCRNLLAVGSIFVAVHLVGVLRSSEVRNSGPGTLVLELQGTKGDTDVTHFSPVLTPRIANNPVILVTFDSPSNDRDDMVNRSTTLCCNTSLILQNGSSVNATADRSTSIDLFLHACGAGDEAVKSAILVNSGVGKLAKFLTKAAVVRESRASSGDTANFAGGVDVFAEAFTRLAAAGEVRVGSLVRNTGATF